MVSEIPSNGKNMGGQKPMHQRIRGGFSVMVIFITFVSIALQANMAQFFNYTVAPYLGWIIAAIFGLVMWIISKPAPVYLVDFACYKPDDSRKCSPELMEYFAKRFGVFTEKTFEFGERVILKSGIGDETYAPPGYFHEDGAKLTLQQARQETEEVLFGAMDELLEKTRIKCSEIGVVIVNCSCFNPTPSWSAMIVNKYKLEKHVVTYNLGGMGCSAGIIAIDLAKTLLRSSAHAHTYAVVLSTENTTLNLYLGNYRPMIVTNCLFKVGGAAMLLSNRRSDRSRSMLELQHCVRVHIGSDDKAYSSIFLDEDPNGVVGVTLTKHVKDAAAEALKFNFLKLGPLVLPWSEKIKFLVNLTQRKVMKMHVKRYMPDFKSAFDHFLLHPGGRAVLDELQNRMNLSDVLMEPSRMSLYRFGNTSSSCIWYEMAYLEAKGRIKKGDRILQLGIGAGFKCNTLVWKALRDIPRPSKNPWLDCIDSSPVHIPIDREEYPRAGNVTFKTLEGKIVQCNPSSLPTPKTTPIEIGNDHNNDELLLLALVGSQRLK